MKENKSKQYTRFYLQVTAIIIVLAAEILAFLFLLPMERQKIWLALIAVLLLMILLCHIAPFYDLPKPIFVQIRRYIFILVLGGLCFSFVSNVTAAQARFYLLEGRYQKVVTEAEETLPPQEFTLLECEQTAPYLAQDGEFHYGKSEENMLIYFKYLYTFFQNDGLLFTQVPKTLPDDFSYQKISWINDHWAYVKFY